MAVHCDSHGRRCADASFHPHLSNLLDGWRSVQTTVLGQYEPEAVA